MELLEAELRSCADAQRKEEIKSEMRVLRRDQTNLSVKKGKPKKHVVPLPQSYLEKRKETREAAARVSERHKIKTLERSRTSDNDVSGNIGHNQLGLRRVAVTASAANRNEGNGNGNAIERHCCGIQCGEGQP